MTNQAVAFQKIVIFGVGLIGGSFSLALKQAGQVAEVVGFGRTPASLTLARELGIIDRIGVQLEAELRDADLVLIATPVAQIPRIFNDIKPWLGPLTIVTDAGSTKTSLVEAARLCFAEKIAQYVPAHPIAGGENSGTAAARVDLYAGKKVVLTPLAENTEQALARVSLAWHYCGAKLFELSPEQHDRVFAAVSHLPHLLSFALVHELAVREDSALYFDYAASGFRDFTRIAASHPEMWRDICLSNREALLQELAHYQEELIMLQGALEKNDGSALEAAFDISRRARRSWADSVASAPLENAKK